MSSNLLRTLQRICPLHLPPLPRRRRSIFSSNKSQSTHPKPTCTLCLHASYLIRSSPTCPYVCMLPRSTKTTCTYVLHASYLKTPFVLFLWLHATYLKVNPNCPYGGMLAILYKVSPHLSLCFQCILSYKV